MPIATNMLTAFVKVARHLSVSAAAIELDGGKGAVSKRSAQLESAVKATLFSRTTRKAAVTPAGDAYLEFARRALHEAASVEERLRYLRTELTGQIRITAAVSGGQAVLAKCLPEFLRLHPLIEIELLLTDRMPDLARERIDIALRWTCMSYWRVSADDGWVLRAGARRGQVRVRGRYHANNSETVVEAALAGLGIALLPGYLCSTALADGRLVRVLPAWTPQTSFGARIFAFAPPERMRVRRNQMPLAFLRQQFGA